MQNVLFYFKKYGKSVLFFSLLLVSLMFQIYIIFFSNQKELNKFSDNLVYADLDNSETDEPYKGEKEILSKKVFVDIKGAVKKPGVYEMDNNAIINDVIKLAGGYTTNAYQNGINLSKRIKDEMVIYIYNKTEMAKHLENNDNNSIIKSDCKTPDYNICECVNDKYSIIEVGSNNKNDGDKTEINELVNINTADVSKLGTLNGIGESKAQAIIKYREDNGKFTKIEDIMNVSGIGEKAFEKIKDFITV
jgi:competence protein ComEA